MSLVCPLPLLFNEMFAGGIHTGPMHKQNFSLILGTCLNDDSNSMIAFDVQVDGNDICMLLPEEKDLDVVFAMHHWMVKHSTA